MTEKEALNLYRSDNYCEGCAHSGKEGDEFPCSRCSVLLEERPHNCFEPKTKTVLEHSVGSYYSQMFPQDRDETVQVEDINHDRE